MTVVKVIYYLSLVIWLIPPVRQFRGDYFYFFLILALLDPAASLLYRGMDVPYFSTYTFGGFLVMMSLTGINKKNAYIYLPAFLLLLYLNVAHPFNLRILIIIEYLVVAFIIQKRAIQHFFTWQKFYPFHLVLLFYVITVITKFMFLLLNIKGGDIYFYITSFFEIIIAIYFCIVKGEEKKTN